MSQNNSNTELYKFVGKNCFEEKYNISFAK